MKSSLAEKYQILHEIAMSIGTSLDLHKMLSVSLSTIIKRLNCSAGGIHFRRRKSQERLFFERIFSIPRDISRNETYQAALQVLADEAWLEDSSQQLPISGQLQAGSYFHVLELPDLGVLILIKNGQDLDPLVVKSLKPLLSKLAGACQACLQNEELHKTHAWLRQASARNQAILNAIPDLMFYLSPDCDVLDSQVSDEKDLPPALSPKAITGRNLGDMLPPDVVDRIARYVAKALDSGEVQVFEYQLPVRQGVQFFEARLMVSGPGEVLAIVRNISERKLAQERIESLSRFPGENPQPVMRVRQDGNILYANAASQPLLDDWQRGVGQSVPADLLSPIELAANTASIETVEVECRGRYFLFLISPVPAAGYLNLYGMDITDHKRAEAALLQSELRLRGIINTAPDGIITIDERGIIEMFNPAAEHIFGFTSQEVVGNNVTMLMPSPYRDEHDGYMARYLSTGQSRIIGIGREVQGRRKDGTIFPLYLSVGEIRLGDRLMFTGILQDITQRKRAEQTLSTVLDTVGEGIVTADHTGTIVMVNREAQRIWGYEQEQLVGQSLQMLMPQEYRAAHRAGMERYLQTGEVHVLGRRIELEGLKKDGSTFPLETQITETRIGEELLFTAAVRDISRRREFDRMRENFVSTVSHELRTPLASIMGWADTLLEGRPGPLTDRQQHALQVIGKSSERLGKLIEEILTVSRIQRGTLQLKKEPFAPSQAVQNVQDMVASLISAKSIALEVHNEWPPDELLDGDQDRLEQAIINLISNAIKFTPEGGRVYIHSRRDEEGWYFKVADTGIGIPEADRSRLFERFFRAGNASEEQFQGTGLGLYVCKAIIEGHGGQIGLESELGVGTTVWFTIHT